MHNLNDDPDLFVFSALPDEAVIAINDFIEELYTRFQNHYFAQMHRYYHDRPDPGPLQPHITLPPDDPPF